MGGNRLSHSVKYVPSDSRDQGQNFVIIGWVLADRRGQIMKRLTSAQLFGPPKSARKTKARLARAKLLTNSRGAKARGSDGAAVCRARFSDAPNASSHRIAETPLG
jgi:hypothetical protein